MPRRLPLPLGEARGEGLALALSLLLAACGGATPAATSASSAGAAAAGSAAKAPAGSSANGAGAASAKAAASAKPAGAASGPAGASAKPGAAGTGAGASGAAGSGTKIAVAYSVGSPGFWPLYMAADTGIFQKNGLDASLQLIPGAPNATAAMISGQIQFAQFGGGAAMSAAANGSDLVILAIVVPVDQFVIYGNSSVKSQADLKGKKIGVVALGGSEDNIAVRSGLTHAGIDPDKDVQILPVGQDRVSAMVNGAVQAASLTPPDTLKAEANGFHSVLDLAALHVPHLGQSSVSTRAYVTAHRDVAQAYVNSMIEGIAKLKADRTLAISVLGKRIKSDDQQAMGVAYDFYTKEIFPTYPEPKPELFQDAIDGLSKEDPKIKSFDPNKIVEPSFVKNAEAAAPTS
jgi:NitT/TauT family transport system substrate-binding protein